MTVKKMLAPFLGPIVTVFGIVAVMAFFLWFPQARAADGCVEIRFPTKAEAGDTAVRFPILAPAGSSDDIVKDACTAIKRAGDADFGPWRNDFCEKAQTPKWVCDFAHAESKVGKKVVLVGSFVLTQHGEHSIRLPAYFADESKGYVTAVALIRGGEDSYPPAPPTDLDFKAGYDYGSLRRNWLVRHSTDAMGVRWFDYFLSTKRAIFFYTKGEAEANKWATKLYFPAWGESPLSN